METIVEMERMVKIAKAIFNVDEVGVTYNDLLILSSIDNGRETLKDIRRFLLIDKSSVHRKLNKLLEDGIICKEGSLHYQKFKLSEEGSKILKNAEEILDFIREEDLKGIVITEKNTLAERLIKYNEKLAPIYCKS